MSMSDKLRCTVRAAVHAIEHTLTPSYPQRFPTINAAKLFVQALCDAAAFDYGLPTAFNLRPTDPHHIVRLVKDRVCFLIAVRAHEHGEFYLDEALPDRQRLRDAIEAEIPRVSALIQAWPTTFASADVAAKYVAGVAALRRFEYTRFEGVSKEKFRAYVMWNTARRAWEGEGFEMERVPKEWKRRAEKTKKPEEINDEAKTLTEAIESDITRLFRLIPREAWHTSFSDLNAARNFVGQWCYDNHFRYAGWPDVELRKYRLFVNFNAARYALEAGIFEVECAVPPLAKNNTKGVAVSKEDEVKVNEVKASTNEESGSAPVFGPYVRSHHNPKDWIRVDDTGSASTYPSTPTSLPSDQIDDESTPLTPATPEQGKEAAPVDPFKVRTLPSQYPDFC